MIMNRHLHVRNGGLDAWSIGVLEYWTPSAPPITPSLHAWDSFIREIRDGKGERLQERRPLKILQSIVLHGWNAGSWYAVEFSKVLQRKGHDILFLTPEGGITAERARQAGLRVDTSVDLKQRSPGAIRRNVRYMRALLARERFDVINAHWGEDHLYWALILRFLAPERAALVRIRSVDPRLPKRHPLNKMLNRRWTDLILVSNRSLRLACEKVLKLGPEKIVIVSPGLDVGALPKSPLQGHLRRSEDAKRALGIEGDALVVGLLARFSEIKGHRYFIEAARQVARSVEKAVFLIVGYECGLGRSDVQAWVRRAGIADRTCILDGKVRDIRRIMEAVDLGVVSSIGSEAISRIVMEYMAMGKPVVSTAVGGIPEMIVHGRTGILVPPKDPRAMAEAIIALSEERERLSRMGALGRRRMEQAFSIEEKACEMEDAFYRILEAKSEV